MKGSNKHSKDEQDRIGIIQLQNYSRLLFYLCKTENFIFTPRVFDQMKIEGISHNNMLKFTMKSNKRHATGVLNIWSDFTFFYNSLISQF